MGHLTPEAIWAAVLATASAVVLLSNAAEKIVKAWSVSFAAFVLWGEMLGLWEIIDEKENL